MATVLKSKSFQKNLLISIGGIFLLFIICICIYQYQREKEFKIDIMHSRLQMYNYEMVQTLGENNITNDSLFFSFVNRINIKDFRVSIINKDGIVLIDSYNSNPKLLGNHLKRTEIQQALNKGNGYDIKRISESTHETYFYSATRFGDLIIRTAVPYSAELTQSLKADNSYIYFTIILTILFGFALYWNTHRISSHIEYLRKFAVKAEKGEDLDNEIERRLPNDELGDISHTIIMLYLKLRHSEEDKLRIKRQLTQNATHELKTPATSIHGFLESILDNPNMDSKQQLHFLERCYAQSERMNKLLFDMSTLSKLDEMEYSKKTKRQDYKQVKILNIINDTLDDTTLQLQNKGINVDINVSENAEVYGEPTILYSIFRNLIDNVISYATGATVLKITCSNIEIEGKYFYEFIFSDNGIGVEPQHLPHLFERFYRIDKGRSRKLGGTGLGLAIVKNAVATHNGTATALSTPNGGLTIKFTLARF